MAFLVTRRPLAASWLAVLVAACGLFASSGSLRAAAASSTINTEFQVKAVFLFNFAQFVEWPERAFANRQSPLVIGVLGQNPFGTYLDDLVKGEKIRDRSLVIKRFARLEDVTDCHILFVCRSEATEVSRILTAMKGKSTLTVSDMDNFASLGGMVRLVTENSKIELRINLQPALDADLVISSKLLRPAILVTPTNH